MEPTKLQIRLPDDQRGGAYCNLVIINHSPDEFVLDFVFVQPGQPQAEVRSRVILSPGHAKRFLAALGNNINGYEQIFGKIVPPQGPGGGTQN